jgi:undecaprenyl diphosphate synthase
MDGNGRWATEQGKSRLEGHAKGYETLQKIVFACGEQRIPYLTVYAFSAENWRRPEDEVGGLMELIEHAMLEQIRSLKEHNVRTKVIGRLCELPETLRIALLQGMDETKDCTGLTFTLAINYGGRAEIVDAVKSMLDQKISTDEVTEELICSHLYDPELPDTDLMIRTAGEMRWSNFLIWQSAYAELVVTQKPWPEFTMEDLKAAIEQFQNRTRKFGAVVEPT